VGKKTRGRGKLNDSKEGEVRMHRGFKGSTEGGDSMREGSAHSWIFVSEKRKSFPCRSAIGTKSNEPPPSRR